MYRRKRIGSAYPSFGGVESEERIISGSGNHVLIRSAVQLPPRVKLTRQGRSVRMLVLLALVALITFIVMIQEPIHQDPLYHQFADDRRMFDTRNGLNVWSNLPFLLVGLHGLLVVALSVRDATRWKYASECIAYVILFTGVAAVSWGSSYYHLDPDNDTLYWDRLPMSFSFMALFAALLSERVSRRLGLYALAPLVIAGVWSVNHWANGELYRGEGDLRFYAIVQFGPMVCAPLLLGWFPSRYSHGNHYWACLVLYCLAKVAEVADRWIFVAFDRILSGHSLKHLLAAAAIECVVVMLHQRKRFPSANVL